MEKSCLKCGKEIKPLGMTTVACHCASFTIGIDTINATDENGMVYGSWPVTMADIIAIRATRPAGYIPHLVTD